jgi:hypothetical protein
MEPDYVCKYCGRQLSKSRGAQCLTRPNQTCSGWTGEHIRKTTTMKALIFAYGLDIDPATMMAKYPSARVRGEGTIRGYRLIFTDPTNEVGVPSITPHRFENVVQGVIYELNHWDVQPVQQGWCTLMDICQKDNTFVRAYVFGMDSSHLVAPTEACVMELHRLYGDHRFSMKNLEDSLDRTTY